MTRLDVLYRDLTSSHAIHSTCARRWALHSTLEVCAHPAALRPWRNGCRSNTAWILHASSAEQGVAGVSHLGNGDQPVHLVSEVTTTQDAANFTSHGAVDEGNGATGPSSSSTQGTKRGLEIRVENVKKTFRTRQGLYKAVDDVSISVRNHSLTALLGPSGSGKTTLLRMIAGLEQPDAGRIYFDGIDATELEVKDRNIGFVFQNYALFNHMTVAQNIAFGPKMRKLDIDIDKRVEELLDLVELPGLGGRYPKQMSGGQRQRVALARALACEPKLLLLDEPFGALDPLVRENLREDLLRIVDKTGVTTIIVTHDQDEAFDLANHIVVFNKGKVEQEDEPAGIAYRPKSAFVMNFIGDTNTVPAGCLLVRRMGFVTDKPLVMFRPRDVEIFFTLPPDDPKIIPAIVTDKKHIGWLVKYFFQTDDGTRFEKHVRREVDDELYSDLDTLQRVFIKVRPLSLMGYSLEEVDSSPLQLV